MKHNIFISYAGPDKEIVENLRDHLKRLGVDAWVFSIDRTMAKETWPDIEQKIQASEAMLFAVSEDTTDSKGQRREMDIALERIEKVGGNFRILPIVLGDTPFSALPNRLKRINGERLTDRNVKTVALRIAKGMFPARLREERKRPWRFPVPGQWLEVSALNEAIEQYFDIGDKLYFRAISPIGLFECYAPKLNELFWISPENVRDSDDFQADRDRERTMPARYRVSEMIEIWHLGWECWQERHGDRDKL